MRIEVVRVFVDAIGHHGNELGLVLASDELVGREQALAAHLGFSETVVVDGAPVGGGHRGGGPEPAEVETPASRSHPRCARLRIFTPAVELPFAGHPTVGTAWWLASRSTPVDVLEVPAGDVAVRQEDGLTLVAARPEWAPDFAWQQLPSAQDVEGLDASGFTEGIHYVWAWEDEAAGAVRSRMFAPALGVTEDEATGSAAVRLAALLGRDLEIRQGLGSRISARLLRDGRVLIGGRVVSAAPVEVDPALLEG